MEIVRYLFGAVPLAGALLLLRVGNVPRARRHQQFALPFGAMLYAVIALVVLYRFNAWFDALLETIFGWIPMLAPLYQTQWLNVIENTAIVVVFFVLKLGYRAFAGRLFTGDGFFGSAIVERFYEYDAASGRWFVQDRLGHLRIFLRVFYWVSLVIAIVIVIAMNAAPDWPGFSATPFPAIAVLVLGEALFAVDGLTRIEEKDSLTGESDSSRRIVNYAALREVFRRTFGERIIDEGIDLSGPQSLSWHRTLEELSQSPDAIEQLFSEYFDRAKQSGLEVDENLVYASLGVLRGTSTLINTPFYSDLTHYLALPSYINLLRGGKCLIVVGRDAGAQETANWFADALESVSGVPELWDIRVLTGAYADGLDVGVLRAADLHNFGLMAANDGFLENVETVLLLEPSRVLATGQLGLGALVSRLGRGRAPVYVALDRNHDGLVDALSHLLKVNLIDVVATQPSLGANSQMVWRAEGPHLASELLPGVSRYLGVGTEIAAVALKYHVSEVEWVGGDAFPVTDMSWIAGQYFGKITEFAELDPSQRSLATSLLPRPNPLSVERRERHFLVVEDEFSNVYESLRLYGSRATESGFVNLISEDYLMRDYMVDNRELFDIDPKAIPALVPDYARTRRNTILKLLMLLSVFDLTESFLLRELELVGCVPEIRDDPDEHVREAPVVTLLKDLIEHYLDIPEAPIVPVNATLPGAPNAGEPRRFRLSPGTELEHVARELGSAYFLIEDELESRNYVGSCLRGHVAQTVLPGQFLTFGGKYYEVLSIGLGDHREEVVLRRAAEHISGRPSYRALRSFAIEDVSVPETTAPRVEDEWVAVDRLTATVTARTHGYLELISRSELAAARRVTVAGIAPRRYVRKDVLRISMPRASAETRRTIALLLNELFVTLFPTAHSFLVALVPGSGHAIDGLLPELEADDDTSIFIVEDSLVDLGLLIAAQRHWRRMFETITDYLRWLETPWPEPEEAKADGVVFEGESDAERAERERAIAEAEARGAYLAPAKPPLWQRILQRLKRWAKAVRARFTRSTAEKPAGQPKPVGTDASPPPAPETPRETEPGEAAREEPVIEAREPEIELIVPARAEDKPEPEPEPASAEEEPHDTE